MNTRNSSALRPAGRLRLEVRDALGAVVATREDHNTVLRGGAELLASLFTGTAASSINGVAVGIRSEPSVPPYESATLTTTDAEGLAVIVHSAAKLPEDAFRVETLPEEFKVRVTVRGELPAGNGVSPDENVATTYIAEAALGLLAEDGQSLAVVYNRVVFDPVPKGRNHELSLFWEIDFPYGE